MFNALYAVVAIITGGAVFLASVFFYQNRKNRLKVLELQADKSLENLRRGLDEARKNASDAVDGYRSNPWRPDGSGERSDNDR